MDSATLQFTLFISGLIYLILCAGAGWYIALEKGRLPLEGVLFSVVLGPLGMLIVACLPTRGPADTSAQPASRLTADPEDVEDPEQLQRWLKRAGK